MAAYLCRAELHAGTPNQGMKFGIGHPEENQGRGCRSHSSAQHHTGPGGNLEQEENCSKTNMSVMPKHEYAHALTNTHAHEQPCAYALAHT